MLLELKSPMSISVESKLATYHHVVVVWREMVIDYESIYVSLNRGYIEANLQC